MPVLLAPVGHPVVVDKGRGVALDMPAMRRQLRQRHARAAVPVPRLAERSYRRRAHAVARRRDRERVGGEIEAMPKLPGNQSAT